jgi:uncharacterized membrane protein
MVYGMAFLIGVVAGLRVMTSVAAVSWAARLGWLNLQGTPLGWLGAAVTPWIFTAAALFEFFNDKRPATGSRKSPPQFIARLVFGSLCGAAIGAAHQALAAGLVLGAVGAVVGTLGGYEFRSRTAKAFGRDLPAALIEDVIAVVLAICSVRAA